MNKHQLFQQIKKKQSFLCVGLDTDINKIPQDLLAMDDPVFEFNKQIINKTAPYAVAYKPNTAFYEVYGAKGWLSLEHTIQYTRRHRQHLGQLRQGFLQHLESRCSHCGTLHGQGLGGAFPQL